MFSKLRGDIACILERDPAARTSWEVLTCYPGLHAIYVHKLARWFWLHGLPWLGRLTSQLGRWLTGIEIHPGAKIGNCVFIDNCVYTGVHRAATACVPRAAVSRLRCSSRKSKRPSAARGRRAVSCRNSCLGLGMIPYRYFPSGAVKSHFFH